MIKILVIAGICAATAVVILFIIIPGSRTLTTSEAMKKIQKLLNSEVKKNRTVTEAIVLIDSPELGIKQTFTAGKMEPGGSFHVASIGKAFTATLIGCLIDEGAVRLDDKISDILPPKPLEGLFMVDGHDYCKEVTVAQLLNQTSGAADYFEDPAEGSEPMKRLIIAEPERFWTADSLLAFSRDFQTPAGKPGEQYHYSDTGYILLGLIVEELTGKAFHDVLHKRIFTPLGMDDSCLMFYSEPANGGLQVADMWIDGTEVSGFKSVSMDWAGGGIISTVEDLSVFVRALNHGELISSKTLESLYNFDQKFMRGIYYGKGFMEYHFEEFFPTLGTLPHLRGHMGALGTQMVYDAPTDTVCISSFGSSDYTAGSVKAMIKILSIAMRIER